MVRVAFRSSSYSLAGMPRSRRPPQYGGTAIISLRWWLPGGFSTCARGEFGAQGEASGRIAGLIGQENAALCLADRPERMGAVIDRIAAQPLTWPASLSGNGRPRGQAACRVDWGGASCLASSPMRAVGWSASLPQLKNNATLEFV